MRRSTLLIAACAAALLTQSVAVAAPPSAPPAEAAPAPVNPRQAVAGIAQAIEERYWDPAKAKAIAESLRAAAAKGEFDRLTDPRDLAQVLTERLQPLDHHFAVRWPMDPPPGGPAPGPGPGPGPGLGGRPPEDPFERRGNYGFAKVDILPGNIGYIELSGFADFDPEDPNAPARAAADAALALVSHADAVIIDVRDNGGGSPAMVGYLASAFLKPGLDVYNVFHTREGTESEAPPHPYAHPRPDVPVYVLISARTGSAAEAFPYTLLAAGRAATVGETTGGAANPGGFVPAGNRFAIFVSAGSPVNAVTHGNWEGTGVAPTIAVPAADALNRARLEALAAILSSGRLPAEEALDAQWALDGLRAELAPPLAVRTADYVGGYGGSSVSASGGGLIYQRGKRPPQSLVALGGDVFTVRDHPSRHLTFERDAAGKVVALTFAGSDGLSVRFHRDP